MQGFKRARRPEQKEARRRAILAAARSLLDEIDPLNLSLSEIGRRAGVTKSNLYRYFESREGILLQLFIDECEAWVQAVERRLSRRPRDLRRIARALAASYLERPLLCRLMGMVAAILEHNLSVEAIADAKRDVLRLVGQSAATLVRALPALSLEDAGWAIYTIALYLAGMWPSANPSPAAAMVLERSEFAPVRTEADKDLPRFVEVLLTGLTAAQRR
jgi:AcrR family transcriptional regulator